MDPASTSGQDDDDWEFCNVDGFVFKRKKRRIDPDAAAAEHEAALKQRRDRKMRALLKLKEKYQKEIDEWENVSSTLRAMEERASQLRREQEQEREQTALLASSSPARSLVDELLLKVEAQEAIIQDFSNLCDIAEAMCDKLEQQHKQSLFDLPVWASPNELMQLLCDE